MSAALVSATTAPAPPRAFAAIFWGGLLAGIFDMAATSDGRVYIACSGVNKVGVVEPAR